MFNESLNRFKLDSTRFQHFFTFSTMLDDLFKRTEHLIQQSVECKLKQILKPFKQALRIAQFRALFMNRIEPYSGNEVVNWYFLGVDITCCHSHTDKTDTFYNFRNSRRAPPPSYVKVSSGGDDTCSTLEI